MTKRLGLHSADDNERLACYDKAAGAEHNAAEQNAASYFARRIHPDHGTNYITQPRHVVGGRKSSCRRVRHKRGEVRPKQTEAAANEKKRA